MPTSELELFVLAYSFKQSGNEEEMSERLEQIRRAVNGYIGDLPVYIAEILDTWNDSFDSLSI